jgi:hypothetical protein
MAGPIEICFSRLLLITMIWRPFRARPPGGRFPGLKPWAKSCSPSGAINYPKSCLSSRHSAPCIFTLLGTCIRTFSTRDINSSWRNVPTERGSGRAAGFEWSAKSTLPGGCEFSGPAGGFCRRASRALDQASRSRGAHQKLANPSRRL